MKKYYRLSEEGINIKIIGKFPQSIEGDPGDIQKGILPFEGSIDFDFKLPVPILQKKARLTTMLSVVSISAWYYVVNNDFIHILKDLNIGQFQYWPIDVIQNKKAIKGYNLFYLADTKQHKYIDYKNSSFYVGSIKDYKFVGEDVNLSDYEEFMKIREELSSKDLMLKNREILLNLSQAEEDIFRFVNSPVGGHYVSQRFKKVMEENNFTGIAFHEIGQDNKKIKVVY